MPHYSTETKRLFPVVGPQLYDVIRNAPPSQAIDQLFYPATLDSWWKKNTGLGCSPNEQMIRIFSFHEKALKLELEAKYLKADFYWEKAYYLFFKHFRHFSSFSENPNIKEAIIKELFIDVHLAFFKGIYESAKKPKNSSRAEKHLQYVEEILDRIPDEFLLPFIKEFERFRIHIYAETNQAKAVQIAQKAAKRFDKEIFFEQKATLLTAAEILKDINETKNLTEGEITKAISRLEHLRQTMPREKTLYFNLGDCYFLLMSLQSKAGKYPHALLSLRKAVVYEPTIADYSEWWEALTKQMEIINKEHVPALLKKVNSGRFSLTPIGEIMLQNYRLNYTLVNEFANSEEEQQLIAAQEEASLWRFCQNIGIPSDQLNEDWLTPARKLSNLVGNIIDLKPEGKEEIKKILRATLKTQDFPMIHISEEKATALVMAILNNTPLESEDDQQENAMAWIPYTLTPKYFTIKRSSEPLTLWWFSRKDLASKFLLSASVVLLLILSIFTIKQNQAKKNRDLAYQAVKQAVENQMELAEVTGHYEQFLANPPIFGKDERVQEITSLFEEQFGKWFMESEDLAPEQLQAYQHIYQKIYQ